jgi:hypothetical protein
MAMLLGMLYLDTSKYVTMHHMRLLLVPVALAFEVEHVVDW